MTEKPRMSPDEINRNIAEEQRLAKEATERRRKRIRFDWLALPRVSLIPAGEHPKSFSANQLTMADGRTISMQGMDQHYIYAGDMLGAMYHPEHMMLEAIARAENLFPDFKVPPAVLPPTLLESTHPRTSIMRADDQVDLGQVTLPRVAVIAKFQSSGTRQAEKGSFSSLLVIWFQDRFGDPSADVLGQIAALDWDALAWSWGW